MLNRFFSRIASLCEGLSPEHDSQINTLKQALIAHGKQLPFTKELSQVNELLTRHLQLRSQQQQECQLALLHASQSIHQSPYLTPRLEIELAQLQQQLEQAPANFGELVARIQQLMLLFQTALGNQSKMSALKSHKLLKITQTHARLLLETLAQANLSRDIRLRCNAITHPLESNITPQELLEICQQLLTITLEQIKVDQQGSKDFLDSLNEALFRVRNVLNQSLALNKEMDNAHTDWHQQVNLHVKEAELSLDNARELEPLKQQLATQFAQLSRLMQQKETAEQKDGERLRARLFELEKRLDQVESEAQSYKDKLLEQQQLSMKDSLTKLPNRAALDEYLPREFKRSQLFRHNLWVVIADIDFFKHINDNFGHIAGDKTLQVIATALSRSMREGEFIARFGGEEFVILLPNLSLNELKITLDRVRERIKNIPFMFKKEQVRITISMGASQVHEHDKDEFDTFERADAALFKAKRLGRDRVEITPPEQAKQPEKID